MLNKRLKEIQNRKKELRTIINNTTDSKELDKIEEELRNLEFEKEKIEKRQELEVTARNIQKGNVEVRSLGFADGTVKDESKRNGFGKDLLEKRTAKISSDVLVPSHFGTVIQTKFNEVSGIIDLVQTMHVGDGNQLNIPYAKNNSIGGITDEGEDYEETNSDFGNAEINGIKVTAYTQYSEEVEKLTTAQYEDYIQSELINSLNRKIVEQIVKGNNSKQFSGIYDTTVADETSDIEISTIDCDTLNTIVYGHNTSAEEIEANMVLALNKKDLGEFAKVKDADGRKVYEIQYNETGMAGTINGTKFIICNATNSFNEASGGQYTMAYIDLSKYMLAVFSPIDVQKDYSSGFRKGLIAVKASVVAGGSLVSPHAVTRIKKAE